MSSSRAVPSTVEQLEQAATISGAPGSTRITFLGCPLDAVTMAEAVRRCEQAIDSNSYLQHMAMNVAKLMAHRDDPALRAHVEDCGLVTADGQGVVWGARFLRMPVPERVAGIDLMKRLLEVAEERGFRVYLLGAKPDVLHAALTRLTEQYPDLQVAGARDGYFTESEEPDVCRAIRSANADILFVAMSTPKKEYFLGEHGRSLGVPFVMGVGGSVDVIAGVTRRAPRPFQRLGLEWAYRLVQEPRRLSGRYLRTNARFAALLIRSLVARRGSADVAGAPGAQYLGEGSGRDHEQRD